jgi:hypothetical protein
MEDFKQCAIGRNAVDLGRAHHRVLSSTAQPICPMLVGDEKRKFGFFVMW